MTAVATRMARRTVAGPVEAVARDVWVVRGGFVRGFNAYLIRHGGELTLFDAGIRAMAAGLRDAIARLTVPLARVVLSHAHVDHRGAAPGLGAPVLCHPDEVADAQGDGGVHYQRLDELPTRFARWVIPRMNPVNDGGPVEVAGTLGAGDRVAGFDVVPTPGHSPGHIALWRDADGVLLGGDAFTTFDLATLRACPAALGPSGFACDEPRARRSLLELADLAPRLAAPGHGRPATGDVAAQLRAAAGA